eukprot:gene15343-16918_t
MAMSLIESRRLLPICAIYKKPSNSKAGGIVSEGVIPHGSTWIMDHGLTSSESARQEICIVLLALTTWKAGAAGYPFPVAEKSPP